MWKKMKAWFQRLYREIEWRLNQRLLGRAGYAACDRCRWVFPISELTDDSLCPGCDAWDEEKRWTQEEIDAAWREYEREREEEISRQLCSICGHPAGHHYADGCDDCPEGYGCGDPNYDSGVDPWEEEPVEVYFTESPGGHRGYE